MTAIVVLTKPGLATARRLQRAMAGARIHGLAKRIAPRDVDTTFSDVAAQLRRLFKSGVPIVGVCASGILIRALAPLLKSKADEPAVLAVSEDGKAAVPLLGGHRGANTLARRIARITKGVAAVTTAGDRRFGFSLDEPPAGWRVGNPARMKPVTAALLAGEKVALKIDKSLSPSVARWLGEFPFTPRGRRGARITDRAARSGDLLLHPPTLALGVGCERGASAAEIRKLTDETLKRAGLSGRSVALVCSVDLKADEPAVHALARRLNVPVRFFSARELEKQTPRLRNPSPLVFRETGCHGVAEGAALAAVGARGALIVAKRKSARATCAVARSPVALAPARIGRARGRLFVIGIGPGDKALRAPAAEQALAQCAHVVGYSLYLDLLGEAVAGKKLHRGKLGAEEGRVRRALDLAARGANVALVSSGDAGIYALASLVFELLERENRPRWNRIEVEVIPGISAMLLAAARAGAPLGHDFCAISLSDLLTPWPAIERRLKAAAAGDFVVALFNPASARRREQLAKALSILRSARGGDVPVVIARNLGRDGEQVDLTTLDAIAPHRVDMLTLVLVGSSQTRTFARGGRRWVYTPRGYAAKGT